MFVSPLCDVGRRIHDALIERHVSQKRKMLIFALTVGSDNAQTVTINSIKPIASLLTKTLSIRCIALRSFNLRTQIFDPFLSTAMSSEREPKRRSSGGDIRMIGNSGVGDLGENSQKTQLKPGRQRTLSSNSVS